MQLVLSLFPGVDLLGRAFSAEGFAVVLGPDTLWDSPIEVFSVPPGRFDGVIGGPPCQQYSDANRFRKPELGDRLVTEFLRVVDQAQPSWFLMENVRMVPNVAIEGYRVQRLDLTDCECGGKQRRLRHLQFGSRVGNIIRPERLADARPVTRAVLGKFDANDRHGDRVAAQGFTGLTLRSLTKSARAQCIGNGVPLRMGTTLARAVKNQSSITDDDCICGCGRVTSGNAVHATASCRKRMERRRNGLYRTIQCQR